MVLFLFNQFGMLERCALRTGNVHSADGWRDVLDPVIARYAGRDLGGRFFRADAIILLPAVKALKGRIRKHDPAHSG